MRAVARASGGAAFAAVTTPPPCAGAGRSASAPDWPGRPSLQSRNTGFAAHPRPMSVPLFGSAVVPTGTTNCLIAPSAGQSITTKYHAKSARYQPEASSRMPHGTGQMARRSGGPHAGAFPCQGMPGCANSPASSSVRQSRRSKAMNKLVIGLLLASVAVAGSACAIVPLGYPGVYAPGPVIVAPGYGGGWHHRRWGW